MNTKNDTLSACRQRLFLILLCLPMFCRPAIAQSVTDYVDPRIGSEGLGRVYVGPCMPFGMIKPSPDCGTSNNAGWAKMPAAVSGFSQTHVSGTGGGPKYGNILILPYSSSPRPQHRKYEKIKLGFYETCFEESNIKTEIVSSRRASLYRFTFPKDSARNIHIDLTHFLGRNPVPKAREAQQFEDAGMSRISETETTGFQTVSGGWNNGKPYTVFFYLCTNKDEEGVMLAKIGISFVSEEQARKNCEEDIPDWNLEALYGKCISEWENLLGRLPIQSDATEQVKRMYYTALYHTCLMPTERTEAGKTIYDDYYAIWDTYRTSTPLLSLLAPERATGMAQSLLDIYQSDGYLPDARSGNSNGRTQGGSNAEIVLCDALARGLNIDGDLALEAMLKDATVPPVDDEAEGRGGLAEYNSLGYIPYISFSGASEKSLVGSGDASTKDSKDREHQYTSYTRIARAGNRTVEYAFCDWAIAQVAKQLAEKEINRGLTDGNATDMHRVDSLKAIASRYTEQSQRWKNLWRSDYEHDGFRGFIMPKDDCGRWIDRLPFGHSSRQRLDFAYTPDVSYEGPWYCKWWDCFMYEASSWEYSFAIPHDIPGLIEACGGKEIFEARLDTFFAHGYYNVANEPSFLTPCLYHFIGKPEKSIARVRDIIETHFSDQPDGLPGNDDGGAMSSWLACHLLGKYPLAGTTEWLELEPILSLAGNTKACHTETNNNVTTRHKKDYNEKTRHNKDNNVTRRDKTTSKITTEENQNGEVLAKVETKYSLHGQTRRFNISIIEVDDSLRFDWTIERNLRLWHGSYSISPKARKNAKSINYVQPIDGQHIALCKDETYGCISQKALRDLLKKGTCKYSGTKWVVMDDDGKTIHARDIYEGAEMWIMQDERLPLILKMQNNPVEIDWETRIIAE